MRLHREENLKPVSRFLGDGIAVALIGLALFSPAQAQPVVMNVRTNHGGDTIYLGNPAEIVFHVDAGPHGTMGMNCVFQFHFTNGLSVGPMTYGDNFKFSPYAITQFATLVLSPNWVGAEDPDTVFFSGVAFGGPWTGSHDFATIRFEPQDTGTIFLDTIMVPPANHTGAYDPFGATLPLDWRPGPIVVVPCPWVVGDLSGDGFVTLGDIIRLINYVFKSGAPP